MVEVDGEVLGWEAAKGAERAVMALVLECLTRAWPHVSGSNESLCYAVCGIQNGLYRGAMDRPRASCVI